jgi:hypothetical protein
MTADRIEFSSVQLQSPPSLLTVLWSQLFAVIQGIKKEILIFVGALIILVAFGLVGLYTAPNQSPSLLDLLPDSLLTLIGILLPLGVWRSEDPARRSYHWSFPTSRFMHSVIKTAAGWIWLMVGIATYVVVAGLVNIFGPTGFEGTMRALSTMEWWSTFGSSSIAYFLMSALVIASGHPWRWILGGGIAYLSLIVVLLGLGYFQLVITIANVIIGQYGILSALRGMSINLEMAPFDPVMVTTVQIGATSSHMSNATVMVIWLTIGVLAVLCAAYGRARTSPRSE